MTSESTIALLFVVLAAQACSASTTTIVTPPDAGDPPPAEPDASDDPVDAAPDSALLDAGPDRYDSGKLSFGATCLADGDCDSNVCAPNDTGGPMWCSFRCTKTTQAEKCPVPPTPGTCNTHGYCRNQ